MGGLAGPFLLLEPPKLSYAKVGYLPKNFLIVHALVAMVDGRVKLFLTSKAEVFAGIQNTLALLAKEVALLLNVVILVLMALFLAKIRVAGFPKPCLEILYQSALMPVA